MGGELSPREAASGSGVGRGVVLSRRRGLAAVVDVVPQTAVVGVAVAEGDQGLEGRLGHSGGVGHGNRRAGEDDRKTHGENCHWSSDTPCADHWEQKGS